MPRRLHLWLLPLAATCVLAQGGETLSALSARSGNQWNVNQTAVMNSMFATDTLEAGRLVKVALSQPYVADR